MPGNVHKRLLKKYLRFPVNVLELTTCIYGILPVIEEFTISRKEQQKK
jgi:hypothetical protein